MAKFLTKEGKVLQDLTTRFQVYLERVKNGQVADIDEVIREFSSIADKSLSNANLSTQWKVRDVLRGMNTKMRAVSRRYKDKFLESLDGVADTAASYEVSSVNKLAGGKVKKPSASKLRDAVHNSTIQATGTQMEAFVDSWGESAIRRVNKSVSIGVAQGLTNQEIVQQIRGTRANNFRDGVLGNATKREANAMVRTATQHAAMNAQAEVYRDNDDIIEGYIWISTLDGRTSATCRALDLQQFETDKGPLPPIHVNCRSSTIPKIKGVDLLGNTTRASADGQVPADMSYYEWLKGQDADFQDEVLGRTRGRLFREESMTPEKFSELQLDKTFQPTTIDEMRNALLDDADTLAEVPALSNPAAAVPIYDGPQLTGKKLHDVLLKEAGARDKATEDIFRDKLVGITSQYREVSKSLRAGGPVDEALKAIDDAIAKSTMKRDVVLYRGVEIDDNAHAAWGFLTSDKWSALVGKPGDVLQDLGYMATSTDAAWASKFGNTMMEIHVRTGQSAFPVPHAWYGKGAQAENEVILPRGAKLRFIGRAGNRYIFEAIP